ncbi:MAG TPA: rhomboid family intramembrane serine protease [Bdellovibrionales bacterium]|nr:rhomboid family intramembrane serine protease [Bdellovibrionales bacterium]
MGVLRKVAGAERASAVWQAAANAHPSAKSCPSCKRAMGTVLSGLDGDLELDVCRLCYLVWLDVGEQEQIEEPLPADPLAAQERKSAELKAIVQHYENESVFQGPDSHELWHVVPALLGLPVEENPNPLRRLPLLTWLMIGVISYISIKAFPNLEEVVKAYAFIPSEPYRGGGMTLLSSFFLHGGWYHLLGNMYFLAIFGDNVEEYLGWVKYLILLAVSTLAAHAATYILSPNSTIPHIGASGGIFGVVAFYMLEHPRSKIRFLFFFFFRIFSLRFSAKAALVYLMLFQLAGALGELHGVVGVAHLAHIGGAAGGLVLWALWGSRDN